MISSSRNYMIIVFKRIGLVAAIMALFGILAVCSYFYSTKTYETSITFSVQERPPVPQIRSEVINFVKSKPVAEKVARNLGVKDTDKLMASVKVRKAKTGKNIIVLSVKGANPEKITETANSWVREFKKAATDTRVKKDFVVTDVQVVSKARVPREPAAGQTKTVIYFLIVGLIVGIGVSIFLEHLDHTLRTANGVELYAQMPFLGAIPPALKEDRDRGKDIDRIASVDTESLMAEAFRNVKVALIFASGGALTNVVVTSSVRQEGKTFIASNMAVTFAGIGESTLLIDADMRKGKLDEVYQVEAAKGLSSFLAGESTLDEVIKPTSVPNLSLLPCGLPEGDPADLLKGGKLDELMQTVKSKFKKVIIDAPALLSYDDSLSWAEKCDGIIYVIGSGFTPLEDVKSAKGKLGQRGLILGAALNNIAIQNDFFYYYSYAKFYLKNKLQRAKK
ncbi:polysaccharide biosynthesis tyrosine autokinase [Candidatus Omnitrophota bacterium]